MYYLNLEDLIKEGENQVTSMMKSECLLFEDSPYGGGNGRREIKMRSIYENFSSLLTVSYDIIDSESLRITYKVYSENPSFNGDEDDNNTLIRVIYEIGRDHFKKIQENIIKNDDKFSFFSNTSISKDDFIRYRYAFRKTTNEKGEDIPEKYEMIFYEGNKMSIEIVNPRTNSHAVSGYLMISEQFACEDTIKMYIPDITVLSSLPYIFATNKDLIESIIRSRVETKRGDLNGETEFE